MYTTHSSYSMCDYCVPSASMRTLLRILGGCIRAPVLGTEPQSSTSGTPGKPTAAQASKGGSIDEGRAAAARFVSCGGLYAVFLLLHHELTGSHHSKVASSIISLLNLVLDTGLDVQVGTHAHTLTHTQTDTQPHTHSAAMYRCMQCIGKLKS
jgi:hypothetical protein